MQILPCNNRNYNIDKI